VADVVPPGYETFREARRRAWDMWSLDSDGKLLGLLVKGQLTAWRANDAGKVARVRRGYWKTEEGKGLWTRRLSEIEEMRGLPIFLTADLQKEMPDHFERRRRETPAARPKTKGGKRSSGCPRCECITVCSYCGGADKFEQ
jgi:hypothetical protein